MNNVTYYNNINDSLPNFQVGEIGFLHFMYNLFQLN